MKSIDSIDADKILSEKGWFDGYTSTVEYHEKSVEYTSFNVEERYEERGDTEHVLFGDGLSVSETVDLGFDTFSIYGVKGHLSAKRLILGDAVLVISGSLNVTDWIFLPEGEGLFQVNGQQIESDGPESFATQIICPIMVLWSRKEGDWLFFSQKEKGVLIKRTVEDLDPSLLEDGYVNEEALLNRLKINGKIFVK